MPMPMAVAVAVALAMALGNASRCAYPYRATGPTVRAKQKYKKKRNTHITTKVQKSERKVKHKTIENQIKIV